MPSDPIALALIRELCRDGSLGGTEIDRIAADLEAAGHGDEAHAVRCEFIQASAPTAAEFRRGKMRIVHTKGGEDA